MIQRLYRNCTLLFASMTLFFQERLLTTHSVSTTGIHLTLNLLFIIFFRLLYFSKWPPLHYVLRRVLEKTLLKAQQTQGLSVVAKVWLITHVRTSNTNFDLNLSSKSCSSFGFKKCTKIQPQMLLKSTEVLLLDLLLINLPTVAL